MTTILSQLPDPAYDIKTYDTKLSPEDEIAFRKDFPNPLATKDYDMRGAWKAGITKAANGHYPDTYKKPNHPTFSKDSMYSGKDGNIGGDWKDLGNGKWSFRPSQTNLRKNGVKGIQEYLSYSDPGTQLELPQIRNK